MSDPSPPAPLVYCWAAPADRLGVEELEKHLASLEQTGRLRLCHPGRLPSPAPGREEQARQLRDRAAMILILVSPDFEARYGSEAEALRQQGRLMIPILWKRVYYKPRTYYGLSRLPREGAIMGAQPEDSRDQAWYEVVTGIEARLALLRAPPQDEGRQVEPAPPVNLANINSFIGRELAGKRGRYECLEWLGRGAYGEVYRALLHDPDPRYGARAVAIKLLHESAIDEVRSLFKLESEHVVRFYQPDTILDPPLTVLVMEYLRGETLHSALGRGVTFSRQDAVRIIRSICDGVAAAHRQHILHRDLKPSNIFLCEPGQRVKLIDFGLSRSAAPREMDCGLDRQLGSQPPSQAPGEDDGVRGDIYQLGRVIADIVSATPEVQRDWLKPVISSATAHYPQDRPSSVTRLRAALDASEAEHAPRPEEKRQRWRGAALGGGLLALGALGVLGYRAVGQPLEKKRLDLETPLTPAPRPQPPRWQRIPPQVTQPAQPPTARPKAEASERQEVKREVLQVRFKVFGHEEKFCVPVTMSCGAKKMTVSDCVVKDVVAFSVGTECTATSPGLVTEHYTYSRIKELCDKANVEGSGPLTVEIQLKMRHGPVK